MPGGGTKILAQDDSVAQMDLSAIASEERMGTPMGKAAEEEEDRPMSMEPVSRHLRSPMDPQSKKALDADI